MKVLYAIQSTGNGHLIRAKEIIPFLKRRFDFDVMLSGPKTNLDLGYPIKYHHNRFFGGINNVVLQKY